MRYNQLSTCLRVDVWGPVIHASVEAAGNLLLLATWMPCLRGHRRIADENHPASGMRSSSCGAVNTGLYWCVIALLRLRTSILIEVSQR